MKKGDRVRDKFKMPKPGDEVVTGTLMGDPAEDGSVTVKWDTDEMQPAHTRVTNVQLLEVVDDE